MEMELLAGVDVEPLRDHPPLPLFLEGVRAGFPSPAADYESVRLDIAQYLIRHPTATFFARAVGDSMTPGICPGDLLVVDRAIEAQDGSVVIAVLDGEMTLGNGSQAPPPGPLRGFQGGFLSVDDVQLCS